MCDLWASNSFEISMVIDGFYDLMATKVRSQCGHTPVANNTDDTEVAPEDWETSA